MNFKKIQLSECLKQVKDSLEVKDDIIYKQVKVSNKGKISLREKKIGIKIGTKKQFYVKKGQFIYSRLGLHTGAYGIIPDFLDGAIVTGDMPVFEIDESIILTDFLILSLNTDFFLNQIYGLNKGVAQSRIREKVFLDLFINIPDIYSQKKILIKYNKIKLNFIKFNDISLLNQQYVSQLKQAILQEAIEGKLTKEWREKNPDVEPASILLEKIKKEKEELIKKGELKKQKSLKEISQEDIPFEIPESWSWCRLGEIIHITSGDFLSSSQMHKNGNIPVFGGNGINGYHNVFNTNQETIVIGRVGFYCGSIHLTPEKAWITDNAFFTIFNSNYVYRDFLIRLLKGTNLKEKENAGAQPVISGSKIYPILIALPPHEEQKEIVKRVDELMKLCDELEKQTNEVKKNSDNLMKAVLQEVFV